MSRLRTLLTSIVAAALAGCALESPPRPDEIRAQSLPNVAIPPAYTAMGGSPGAVNDGWLARFADPQLDALVREALAYNVDLAVAAARVEQAAAYAKLSGSMIYPAVNLLAHGGGPVVGTLVTLAANQRDRNADQRRERRERVGAVMPCVARERRAAQGLPHALHVDGQRRLDHDHATFIDPPVG